MRRRALALMAAVGVAVLVWASPAMAKGPDQATITGPGLDAPIVVSGWGEPGSGGNLAGLADGSGLFLVMFPSSSSDPRVVAEAPAGPLGPRYELAYRLPDGTETGTMVRQDLYPLAEGGPVTYTEAGQLAMGSPTLGGWYRASASFGAVLEQLGLPSSPVGGRVPPVVQPEPQPRPAPRAIPWLPIAAAGLVVLLVVAGVLFRVWRSRAVAGNAALGQRG